MTRAHGDRESLRRDFDVVRRLKRNLAQLLRQRGHRDYRVRQWLKRELAPPFRGSRLRPRRPGGRVGRGRRA